MEGDILLVQRLQVAVDTAGIPNQGVSVGPPLRIDYLAAATPVQIAAGVLLLASFDVRPRKLKTFPTRLAEIRLLKAKDRDDLLSVLLADWIGECPARARSLGIELDGDEPDGG